MEMKKCPDCNWETEDLEAVSCPDCGANLEMVSEEEVLNQNEAPLDIDNEEGAISVQDENVSEEAEDAAAMPNGKTAKITAVVLASVMAAVALFFGGYMFIKYRVPTYDDLAMEDINGLYADYSTGMYFDFEAEEIKVDVPEETASAEPEVLSDGTVASDAAEEAPVKMKTMTFDGSYESGYADDYVDRLLAGIYVEQNALTDEYDEYIKKNKYAFDDHIGFLEKKGVDLSVLDDIDRNQGLRAQGESYKDNGYWRFNKTKGELTIFDKNGEEKATLEIVGNAIVDPSGYLKGKVSNRERYETSFTNVSEDYTETIRLYDDGKFIIEAQSGEEAPQFYAGEYKTDKNYVAISINGGEMLYTKVNDGISFVAYKKQ